MRGAVRAQKRWSQREWREKPATRHGSQQVFVCRPESLDHLHGSPYPDLKYTMIYSMASLKSPWPPWDTRPYTSRPPHAGLQQHRWLKVSEDSGLSVKSLLQLPKWVTEIRCCHTFRDYKDFPHKRNANTYCPSRSPSCPRSLQPPREDRLVGPKPGELWEIVWAFGHVPAGKCSVPL